MFLTLLDQIASFGLAAMFVLAVDAIILTWMGGRWGIVMGELFLLLYIFQLDLNHLPGGMDYYFYLAWVMHCLLVNLLLLPAWVLGLLLRRLHARP